MLKLILNPLLVFIALMAIVLIYSRIRLKLGFRFKSSNTFLLIMLFLIFMLSTKWFSSILEDSLSLPDAPLDVVDANVIVVLAAGYLDFKGNDLTMLTPETTLRLHVAVRYYFKNKDIKLFVVSGGKVKNNREYDYSMTNLMERYALSLGVEPDVIYKDAFSSNTWEHPIGIQKIESIFDKRLVVATSHWHARRAKAQFDRYFDNVVYIVPEHTLVTLTFKSLIPAPQYLAKSSIMIQEYIALTWYALREFMNK